MYPRVLSIAPLVLSCYTVGGQVVLSIMAFFLYVAQLFADRYSDASEASGLYVHQYCGPHVGSNLLPTAGAVHSTRIEL